MSKELASWAYLSLDSVVLDVELLALRAVGKNDLVPEAVGSGTSKLQNTKLGEYHDMIVGKRAILSFGGLEFHGQTNNASR